MVLRMGCKIEQDTGLVMNHTVYNHASTTKRKGRLFKMHITHLMEVLPCSRITSGAIHDGVPLISPLLAVTSRPPVPLALGLALLRQCLLLPKSAWCCKWYMGRCVRCSLE